MMDGISKLVDSLVKVFGFMTWSKILMFALFMLTIGGSIAFWENRPLIYTSLSVGRFSEDTIPNPLSLATTAAIKNVVIRQPNIIAAEVIQTNTRQNTRHGVYFYSEIEELQTQYDKYQQNRINDTPLFIVGDVANNDRVINIIEQEFVCVPLTPIMKLATPISINYAKQVCSISVPPRFGKMVGYVNIWLREPVARDQIPEFKQIMRVLSDEIYDRDVTRTLK